MTAATQRSAAPQGDAPQIEIHVNAEVCTVHAETLADVLVALGYEGQKVATALNGDFVPERSRSATAVATGDRIEILSARQGG